METENASDVSQVAERETQVRMVCVESVGAVILLRCFLSPKEEVDHWNRDSGQMPRHTISIQLSVRTGVRSS